MKVVRKLALVLLLTGLLTCAAVSASPQAQPGGAQPGGPGYRNLYYSGSGPGQAEYPPAQLAHQYAEAKKDEDKKEIRKKLTDSLSQEFDEHIQQQQKELEDLEKQIAALKTVVRKRLEAKPTIVERRAEQLIQEAEGLGWNVPGGPHRPYGPSGALGRPRIGPPGKNP